MTDQKRLAPVIGRSLADDVGFSGYEMHVGETTGPAVEEPFARFDDGRLDGAVSPDGLVTGTYVHGLFADDGQRRAWLARLGATASGLAYEREVETVLDRWADHLERHLDCDRMLAIAATAGTTP
jgi:adenosylcobyric acid synthase